MGRAAAVAVDQPSVDALEPCAAVPDFFFFLVVGGDPGAAGGAPEAVAGVAMLIAAPSLSRSVPLTTTVSPTARPESMAVFLPSLGPGVILRTLTVLSALARYT